MALLHDTAKSLRHLLLHLLCSDTIASPNPSNKEAATCAYISSNGTSTAAKDQHSTSNLCTPKLSYHTTNNNSASTTSIKSNALDACNVLTLKDTAIDTYSISALILFSLPSGKHTASEFSDQLKADLSYHRSNDNPVDNFY
ncbi:hypothetical protein OTSANNIE_1410 [Anaplasma phagocytophilum str. Annie]|nr:hypothetical protein APHHGE2_1433 [Anaplasma phagocytophilum str. HGE2]KJV86814.1 hypothetical protein APHNYW_1151 [Anaplasma phagocytophilum str. ApNYW]KJV98346.1 hypothetical protein OTSANNIE_1410 [Anaplasma phagocytophilum str. Annie]